MRRMNFPARRDERRGRAEASLAEWRTLTIDEQLNELAARPGECKRQIARLKALQSKHVVFALPGASEQQDKVTASTKAPPRSDVKATKAFKRKAEKGDAQ